MRSFLIAMYDILFGPPVCRRCRLLDVEVADVGCMVQASTASPCQFKLSHVDGKF